MALLTVTPVGPLWRHEYSYAYYNGSTSLTTKRTLSPKTRYLCWCHSYIQPAFNFKYSASKLDDIQIMAGYCTRFCCMMSVISPTFMLLKNRLHYGIMHVKRYSSVKKKSRNLYIFSKEKSWISSFRNEIFTTAWSHFYLRDDCFSENEHSLAQITLRHGSDSHFAVEGTDYIFIFLRITPSSSFLCISIQFPYKLRNWALNSNKNKLQTITNSFTPPTFFLKVKPFHQNQHLSPHQWINSPAPRKKKIITTISHIHYISQ